MNVSEWLQSIDRRIVYIAVVIVLLVPLMFKFELPIVVTPPSRGIYNTIEKMRDDQIAFLIADWDPSIQAECEPQTRAVITHLMKRGKRFVIMGYADPVGPDLAERMVKELSAEYPDYRKYGVKWANYGYRPASALDATLQAIVDNIPGVIGTDSRRRKPADLPVMKGIRDMKYHHDVGICVEICGSAIYGYWTQWVYGLSHTPVGIGVTGVMAPTIFPLLDSGQAVGMLAGAKGAAEYEKLVGAPARGTQIMNSQNSAHALVVLLIILGNTGYFAARRQKRGTA